MEEGEFSITTSRSAAGRLLHRSVTHTNASMDDIKGRLTRVILGVLLGLIATGLVTLLFGRSPDRPGPPQTAARIQTPTFTVTETATPTDTPSPTATHTPTAASTATHTPTAASTATHTPTATSTAAHTPTPTSVTFIDERFYCTSVGACIDSPPINAVVTGTITIGGTADIADFWFYKLEWGEGDMPEQWHVIGPVHTEPVSYGVLGVLDTEALPPGRIILRLTVVNQTGNYLKPHEVPIVLEK